MGKEVKSSVPLLFLLPLNGLKICLLAQCDMDFVPIIAMLSPLPPSCKKPPSSYLARRKHGQSYQTGNISCSIMCKSLQASQTAHKTNILKDLLFQYFCHYFSSTAPSDSQIISIQEAVFNCNGRNLSAYILVCLHLFSFLHI